MAATFDLVCGVSDILNCEGRRSFLLFALQFLYHGADFRGEGELLDQRGLRGHSQPFAIALHKDISPHVMIAGCLAVLHGGFIVGACDHSCVAEDAHFHVAQRGGGCVGGLDLSDSLSLGLALAVRGDGDSVICH